MLEAQEFILMSVHAMSDQITSDKVYINYFLTERFKYKFDYMMCIVPSVESRTLLFSHGILDLI